MRLCAYHLQHVSLVCVGLLFCERKMAEFEMPSFRVFQIGSINFRCITGIEALNDIIVLFMVDLSLSSLHMQCESV